jgi:hypothetical protein
MHHRDHPVDRDGARRSGDDLLGVAGDGRGMVKAMMIRPKGEKFCRLDEIHKWVEESENFYIVDTGSGYQAVSKHFWEPVPEKRWVDVTKECEWCDWSGKFRQKIGDREWWVEGPHYRVRKVYRTVENSAFIIEHEE